MKSINFTRSELHELVWRVSLPSISKKYDISYHDLRKTCITMDVPLPKAGYWQNIWLGKEVTIEPLSNSSSAQQECTLNLFEEGDARTEKAKTANKILKEKIEEDSKLTLTVPNKLSKPDALVEAAKKDMDNGRAWDFGHTAGLIVCSKHILDVSVSPGNLGRALRFMDAFIKLIKARGNNIIVENRKTYAVIEGEKVPIVLKEKSKRFVIKEASGYEKSEYKPTGILSFKMVISFYKETEWKDGKLPLEDQLSLILSTMEVKARDHKQEMLRWHKKAEEDENERQKLREEEQLKAKELAAFNDLLTEAQEWRRVAVLREYIDKVEARAIEKNVGTEYLKTWLSWARRMADKYDPLKDIYKSPI